MQFVGSQDGYFLLSLHCSRCSLPVWVNVFAGNGQRANFASDLTINDLVLSGKGPISMDEVLDFSAFIRNFDGNFAGVLGKSDR